jgi:MscS family membrane protein
MIDFFHRFVQEGPGFVSGVFSWRCLIFLGSLVLALLVSKVFEWLAARKILSIPFPLQGDFAQKIIDISNPIIRWAIVLLIASQTLLFLNLSPAFERLLIEIFKAVYAILLAWLLSKLVRLLLDLWAMRDKSAVEAQVRSSFVPLLGKLSTGAIFIIAVLLVLDNAGYNVSGMLAGLGIGGLAVALAAQDILTNLFGSMVIFLDRPFIVGELIEIDKYEGKVEKIGLRSTALRLPNGTRAYIPNKMMGQSPITNISRRHRIQHTPVLRLANDTPAAKIEEALKILREVYTEHPLTDQADIYWRDFGLFNGVSSLDIIISYWCKSSDNLKFLHAIEEINLEVKKRLDNAQVKMA